MTSTKPLKSLLSAIRQNAPSTTVSENYGRNAGYFGDYDESTRGYKAIMIYIQLGLSEYDELIIEVVRAILTIQKGYGKKYQIIPAAFGKGMDFILEGKYFDMGYTSDKLNDTKIAKELKNLSGTEKSEVPAIIPDFFPKTDIRSLYYGKTRFERSDMMAIIYKKDELAFAEILKDKFTYELKKRILFVEIEENNVNWHYKNFTPEFIN
jgi:hypothetical protein